MASTFVQYDGLPEPLRNALIELETFIGDCDGKDTVITTDEHTCIDDGTIDAEDAVRAFNTIVAALTSRPAPEAEPDFVTGDAPIDREFKELATSFSRPAPAASSVTKETLVRAIADVSGPTGPIATHANAHRIADAILPLFAPAAEVAGERVISAKW